MNVPGFTPEALETVNSLLYAEAGVNPLEGKCGQNKLREQAAKTRTPAQKQGDKNRAAARRGKPAGGNRSEAAKKAAATKARCKGASGPQTPTPGTVV